MLLALALCGLLRSGCQVQPAGLVPASVPLPAKAAVVRPSAAPAGCRLNRGGWAELPCVPDQDAHHRHTRGSCARGRPGPHRCRLR
ncbi:hypothetical protein [Streptomyces sp. NPDC048361]|uniref:hypothetical protein n=1 Tax=Streptomyces sp. NPDC048361 TaxID=3154720 RepID=UPI0034154A5D